MEQTNAQPRSLPTPGPGKPEPQCSADGLGVSWLNGAMQANGVLALSEAGGEGAVDVTAVFQL